VALSELCAGIDRFQRSLRPGVDQRRMAAASAPLLAALVAVRVSRELARNASCGRPVGDTTAVIPYDASLAGKRALVLRQEPRRSPKLTADTALFAVMLEYLREGWSPEQIAGRLKRAWPDDQSNGAIGKWFTRPFLTHSSLKSVDAARHPAEIHARHLAFLWNRLTQPSFGAVIATSAVDGRQPRPDVTNFIEHPEVVADRIEMTNDGRSSMRPTDGQLAVAQPPKNRNTVGAR
jgi:hypothetical protein